MQGSLEYDRSVLIPKDSESKNALRDSLHIKSVFPLDDALGISNLPFKMTPALMLRCAYWAQNQCSYQAAENVIDDTYGLKVNDDTIRLVTNYIGKAVFEEDCKKSINIVTDKALEKVLRENNYNYKLIGDTTANIYGEIEITPLVLKLHENGISVKKITENEENLEHYFFSLLGGKKDE